MSEPVKLIVIGCGNRGTGYASFAECHPDRAKIVAVAEPRDYQRNSLADKHHIPDRMFLWKAI